MNSILRFFSPKPNLAKTIGVGVILSFELFFCPVGLEAQVFLHPGLLQKQEDFDRMKSKVDSGLEPWLSGWKKLIANPHSSLNWTPQPADTVYRGFDGVHRENYGTLYNDIAAAYATAIRWKVSGDTAYANKSVQILNAWSSRLKAIAGTNDRVLAAGIYGYEFTNAAEIMRTYGGWGATDFANFQQMMLTVFYPMNHNFLTRNERCITHFYANWDQCTMNSILAIGVLCDNRSIYDEAINYFKTGAGNGSIEHAVYYIHPDSLGQWQESGRDQGHATLGIALMGALCEMAWSQGDDLYGYDNNRFLKGAEYVAKYNLGEDVPYTTYNNCLNVNQTVISASARGTIRPIWELVYNHYVNRKGLAAPYSARFAQQVRPEGGGGNYGPNSGGYDQLGYGTLLYTLDTPSVAALSLAAVTADNLLIYPNPTRDRLTIKLPNGFQNGATIDVFDGLGRRLSSIQASGSEYGLDLSSISRGVYILQINNGTKNITREMVKQ